MPDISESKSRPLPAREWRQKARRIQAEDVAAGVLLAVLLCLYILTALRTSAVRALWMDEVLAAWIARLPAPGGIWDAVARGGEFSPPTYHLFLHAWSDLFGGSALALRVPSLLAALCCAASVYLLVRRRIGFPFAALAVALTLELALYNFAIQARPYTLVTAFFALALLAWDGAGDVHVRIWRPVTLALALSFAVSLHFYACLLVGMLMVMEAGRTLAVRHLRPAMWAALAVPVVTLAAWFPLMRHILRYNAGDTGAAHYLAHASLANLLSAYGDLLLGPNSALLLGFVLIMAAGLLARHFRGTDAAPPVVRGAPDLDFDILTLGVVAIPLLVFVAGVLITRTFNERYALAAALGIAILYARLIGRLPRGGWVACLLLGLSCGLWGIHALRAAAPEEDSDLALLGKATGEAPIVIGEGLHYLQLDEAAPPDLRRRLVFLRATGETSPDPTNEHQVERWAAIRPDLAIEDLDKFMAGNRSFYLLGNSDPKDVVTDHFIRSGQVVAVLGRDMTAYGDEWLMRVDVK